MQTNALLGQIVSFLMVAIPAVMGLVYGLEELGKKLFGYECSHEPPTPISEPDTEVEWGGMFEDPEEIRRRQIHGLPPRVRRKPPREI